MDRVALGQPAAGRPGHGTGPGRGAAPTEENGLDHEAGPDVHNAGRARAYALDLPGATADQPFGAGSEVVRVSGRVFALFMDARSVAPGVLLNLKAAPEEVPLLVSSYHFIRPGYHMNKRHWITVVLGEQPDMELVESLIDDSYDNVRMALPASRRPLLTPQPVHIELAPDAGTSGGSAGG